MKTELIKRQMTFTFDYEAAGIPADESAVLESGADEIHSQQDAVRIVMAKTALQLAGTVADCRAGFNRHGEGTWEKWVKERLDWSVSYANKHLRIHKELGAKDAEELAGVPLSRWPKLCREKVDKRTRNKVLRLAKKHWLSEKQVDELLGEEAGNGQVSFGAAVPTTHEELLAYLGRKVENLRKRIPEDVQEEIPVVLRELADAMNGGAA